MVPASRGIQDVDHIHALLRVHVFNLYGCGFDNWNGWILLVLPLYSKDFQYDQGRLSEESDATVGRDLAGLLRK